MTLPPPSPDANDSGRPSLTRRAKPAAGPAADSILRALEAEGLPQGAGAGADKGRPGKAVVTVALALALVFGLGATVWRVAQPARDDPASAMSKPTSVAAADHSNGISSDAANAEAVRAVAVAAAAASAASAEVAAPPITARLEEMTEVDSRAPVNTAPDLTAAAGAVAATAAAAGGGVVASVVPPQRVAAAARPTQPKTTVAAQSSPRAQQKQPKQQTQPRALPATGAAAAVRARSEAPAARTPSLQPRDPDVELMAALMSHADSQRGGAAAPVPPADIKSTATGRLPSKKQATIAGLVAGCGQKPKAEADRCRREICAGYWGKAQACPARKPVRAAATQTNPSR